MIESGEDIEIVCEKWGEAWHKLGLKGKVSLVVSAPELALVCSEYLVMKKENGDKVG